MIKAFFNRCTILFIVSMTLFSSSVFAASLSEVEILVKEAVLKAQPNNPVSGEPLTLSHIGSLDFVRGFKPPECLALVSGLVYESNTETSDPIMYFVVCVTESIEGYAGEILDLTRF